MENFQSQSHHNTSNFSISQQWRSLQTSISMLETSMANQVNQLQSKEREITKAAKTVDNSQKEVELREKSVSEKLREVDTREKQMSSKIKAFEVKMQQIEEVCKVLQLKCRETVEMKAKLMEEMKVKELEIDERCKSLDCREKEIEEKNKVLELKMKETDERNQHLEVKEKEMNDILKSHELKANESKASFDIMSKSLEEAKKQLKEATEQADNTAVQAVKDYMVSDEFYWYLTLRYDGGWIAAMRCTRRCFPEIDWNQVEEAFDLKEWSGSLPLEMDDISDFHVGNVHPKYADEYDGTHFSQWILAAIHSPSINRDICSLLIFFLRTLGCFTRARSEQSNTSNPQPEPCSELQLLCRNMDVEGMKSYLIEHFKELKFLLKKILDSLQLASDPVKLVLDVIQSIYKLLRLDNVSRQVYTGSCMVLSAALLRLEASVTAQLKEDAKKFSIMWRDDFAKQVDTHPLEISAFRRFIASYELIQSYDTDELLSLLGTFYTESEVLSSAQDSYLCRLLGLEKEILGVIKSLITRKEQLRAVVYIWAFKLQENFPPIPLLKAHLEYIHNRVQEMVNEGTDTAQNDAVNMELCALKAVLKCISNFKLESGFPPAPLRLRIKQLELLVKEREERTTAESLLALKKNCLNLEARREVFHRVYAIARKRASTSVACQSQAKHPKIDAC